MNDRIRQILTRIREFFGKLSKRVKILLIAAAALLLAVAVGLAVYNSNRPYAVLFTELTNDDLNAVVGYLNENGADFKVRASDNTVLVQESQADRLRAQVILQGYPTSGFAYQRYFDNISTFSSAEDRERAYQFDLQDRLGATIRNLRGVQDATVTLAMGENHRYILSDDDVIEATAEVMVTMRPGQSLSDQLATAIRYCVSHAVQDLSVSSVVILDDSGNTYIEGGSGLGGGSDSANTRLALEAQVNNMLRNSIMNVLVPLFGTDNVRVTVSSTVDISRTYREDTVYEEPDWAKDGSSGGQGIIGTWIWNDGIVREGGTTAGGVVGVPSNAELPEYVIRAGDVSGNENEIFASGEKDYLVTQHNSQSEVPGGTVTDVMVAVVVNSNAGNVPNLNSLTELVGRAARIGREIEGDKISILAYPFYGTDASDVTPGGDGFIVSLPPWALYALIAGVALFLVLVLVIVLISSKKRKKKRAAEAAAAEAAAQAALLTSAQMAEEAQGADIMNLNSDRSTALRQDIRQFVEENPSIAAQMVKNWLKGGEEDG